MIPSVILFVGSLLLPETPNSLLERGHEEEARRVLIRVRGTQNIENEFEDIRLAALQSIQVCLVVLCPRQKSLHKEQKTKTMLVHFQQELKLV